MTQSMVADLFIVKTESLTELFFEPFVVLIVDNEVGNHCSEFFELNLSGTFKLYQWASDWIKESYRQHRTLWWVASNHAPRKLVPWYEGFDRPWKESLISLISLIWIGTWVARMYPFPSLSNILKYFLNCSIWSAESCSKASATTSP